MSFNFSNNIEDTHVAISKISPTFTGPFQTSQVVSATVLQVNNLVTITVEGVSAAQPVGTTTTATASGAIPSGLRPVTSSFASVSIINNGLFSNVPGKAEFAPNGDIIVYVNNLQAGLFSILGQNGWQKFSVTYSIA